MALILLATSVRDLEATITLRFGVLSYLIKPFTVAAVHEALRIAAEWREAAATTGTEAVEADRLEEWIDSLEIL